jgi:hypothetical protein
METQKNKYEGSVDEQQNNSAVENGTVEPEVLFAEDAKLPANDAKPEVKKDYHYISPWELTRAKEHIATLKYDDTTDFAGLTESYEKYDRFNPVYYVERDVEGELVKGVIEGWKYASYAQKVGKEQIFACKLDVENDEDLIMIMIQLQRTQHESLLALYYMIQALWPKHFKGPGYRSDIEEEGFDETEEIEERKEGRRPNIYERIGKVLYLSGTKVQHIRKVGMVNPLHFERIEIGRFSLLQAYQECVKEEKGWEQPAPAVKTPVYHSASTEEPVDTAPNSTPGTDANNQSDQPTEEDDMPTGTGKTTGNNREIPEGSTASVADEYIIVRGKCQCCNTETFMKIYKKDTK